MAKTARDPADDGPTYIPFRVRTNEVLRRDPGAVGNIEGLVDRCNVLEAEHHQVGAALVVGNPPNSSWSAEVILIHDRAPNRRPHLERLGLAISHDDGFQVTFNRQPSIRREVTVRILRRCFDDHEIRPVALGVGEAPGNPGVAARNHRRRAWQGDAYHPMARTAAILSRPLEHRPVPGVGDRHPEMHVVGEDCASVVGPRTRHGPVITPDQRLRIESACLCAVIGRHLSLADRNHHTRDCRGLERRSEDGSVPLRTCRSEKCRHFGRQQILEQTQIRLTIACVVVENEKHRIENQRRILGPPGRRLCTKQHVLVRFLSQRLEAGVDTLRICCNHRLFGFRHRLDHAPCTLPKLMHPACTIRRQRPCTKEHAELARRLAPHQIHLKKPFLCVQEAEPPRDIEAVRTADRWHPECVSFYCDRRGQPGELDFAIE